MAKIDPVWHWYCVSFQFTGRETGTVMNASTYTGASAKKVTIEMLSQAKERAGMDPRSIVISINYMGKMTKSQLTRNAEEQHE